MEEGCEEEARFDADLRWCFDDCGIESNEGRGTATAASVGDTAKLDGGEGDGEGVGQGFRVDKLCGKFCKIKIHRQRKKIMRTYKSHFCVHVTRFRGKDVMVGQFVSRCLS